MERAAPHRAARNGTVVIAAAVVAAAVALAEVHGEVVSVDRVHQLVIVHHRSHPGMGMEMMMAVKLRDPRQLAGLKKGQQIRLRCDPNANPYTCVKL